MGKRNPYAGSLAQGQYRQRVVTDKRAEAYRRLIASYMVETVAPDPAPVGDVWIMDPDEAFAMSLRPILERLADETPAQEESWQEPLRQPDEEL